jgi:hypothetical protein
MSIKRLLDAVERRGDIGRQFAALVLPISNRPRVTSRCAGKIGLREPGEHTSGPDLASRDNVAHNRNLYTILETPPRLTRFIESRPGDMLSDGRMLVGVPRVLWAFNRIRQVLEHEGALQMAKTKSSECR